jgi:hypothetical protein
MTDHIAIAKAVVESIWKEGLLRAGLVFALAGSAYIAVAAVLPLAVLGLDLPWVRIVAGFAIFVGVSAAIIAGVTSKEVRQWAGRAHAENAIRHRFLLLTNKARMLLRLAARKGSSQLFVVISDPTFQELLTHRFVWFHGSMDRRAAHASIHNDEMKWLQRNLQFVDHQVKSDETEHTQLFQMMELAHQPAPTGRSRAGY